MAAGKNKNLETERAWAIVCHLGGFVGFIFPFGNVLAPLLIWLFKKSSSPAVEVNGREAVNFQISITLYAVVSALLIFLIVGIFGLLAVLVMDIIFMVKAAVAAGKGRVYHYPLTIRLIK